MSDNAPKREEVKVGFRLSRAVVWVFMVVVAMSLLLMVAVKKAKILVALGAIIVSEVVFITCISYLTSHIRGLLRFVKRYIDVELRCAIDGQYVKVTEVIFFLKTFIFWIIIAPKREEVKVGFRLSRTVVWVFMVVMAMSLLLMVAVKKAKILVALGAIIVSEVVLITCISYLTSHMRGLLGFVKRYIDAELRGATDGQYAKVTDVIFSFKTFLFWIINAPKREEAKVGFRLSRAVVWVFMVVVAMSLLLMVAVKKVKILVALGAIIVSEVVLITCISYLTSHKKGLLGFVKRYIDVELRGATDGQYVNVTEVIFSVKTFFFWIINASKREVVKVGFRLTRVVVWVFWVVVWVFLVVVVVKMSFLLMAVVIVVLITCISYLTSHMKGLLGFVKRYIDAKLRGATDGQYVKVIEGVAARSGKASQRQYDVFVSFRGEDIRRDFLGHLIDALRRKQIYAFVDDKLKSGDEISSSLFGAIETSLISLVIFSEDYASSHWCLKELEKIVECREKYGQTIIPIFYNVYPTNVRHQKESYRNALAKHEEKYNFTRVQTWRDALNQSANLSGIKSSDFRDDVKLIEKIITTVKHELMMRLNKHPIQSKGLIGIGKATAHLESLLRQDSKDVRVIGIWGMGGIGKTTIAQEVLNELSSEYEGCCFLANVREESTRGEIKSLKEKLFSTILAEDVKIDTANELPGYVMMRLSRMKVLIVLDDVNDPDQLEILVEGHDRLGSGSRIIVTTRDKQVLVAFKVDDDDICKVRALKFDEALTLFNLHAFKQNHLEMEYSELSKRVVNYAKGIPLVLKVLGHLLCGKDKEVWESQLDKFKKMPNKKVHNVMKLSYDDLDRKEQRIFLDLACFFSGLNLKVDYIKLLLKDHESDNSVVVGLERLKDKALVIISEDNVVSVHDIIQEMAWEIVRHVSSEDPGSRSHLGDSNDVYEVLKYNKGTMAIRSIRASLSQGRKLTLSPHIFANMSKLQFLDFYSAYDPDGSDLLPQELQPLPTELRYLRWMYYPLRSLPVKFSAEELVILDLPRSRVEKLWDGVQNLVNLKEVNLSWSTSLKELPDFSKATNLEILDISFCDQLTSVHIFSLDKLEKLDVGCCSSLIRLTSDTHLTSLNSLNLGTCFKLREFSVTSENMIELNLASTLLDALPASFGHQSKLEILDLARCDIESLPSSIKNLTRLRHLCISGCKKLQTLPELPPSLETLLAKYCKPLETVLFPSTATEQFNENRRRVEFWDCENLDEHSLKAIELNVQINVMNLAHQHISTPEHDYVENYADQATCMYAYPESRVPEWFEYKTTNDYIIINLSSTPPSPPLGFIFCFIIKEYQSFESLKFNIIISYGEGEDNMCSVGIFTTAHITLTLSDNVCVIYDQCCSRYLNSRAKTQTKFKIKVTAEDHQFNKPIALKGFGVSPISIPTYNSFVLSITR